MRWRGEKELRNKKVGASVTPAMSIPVALGPRSYHIRIASGLLSQVGKILRHEMGFHGKIALVTDRNVDRIYGARCARSLTAAGFHVEKIRLPSGEKTKSLRWVQTIVNRLVQKQFERSSLVLALGGGVIGDITGFAASIYARGLPFIQVPTTLIAQVDSSVGGKTGVNHPLGKNLIGTFYQPAAVLIDPETLSTLPKREFIAGLAEVIKYGMIEDRKLFRYLEEAVPLLRKERVKTEVLLHLIQRSCHIKAKVVGKDERETNRRRVLNYGHTIGHAFEVIGRYKTYIHGEAVAIGMILEAELAHYLGLCSSHVMKRQQVLIEHLGLVSTIPAVSAGRLWDIMMRDKKVVQQTLYCVFPTRIGHVTIAPITSPVFKSWYRQRLEH